MGWTDLPPMALFRAMSLKLDHFCQLLIYFLEFQDCGNGCGIVDVLVEYFFYCLK
jgi:hypothetical protein